MNRDDMRPGRVVGIALGIYICLAGLATLVGMPWQFVGGGLALAVLRVLGAVAATAGGAALAWLAIRE